MRDNSFSDALSEVFGRESGAFGEGIIRWGRAIDTQDSAIRAARARLDGLCKELATEEFRSRKIAEMAQACRHSLPSAGDAASKSEYACHSEKRGDKA
jgi:hypothetical protein